MAANWSTQSKVGRATRVIGRFMPTLRWATLAGSAAILAFGAPTDTLWALGALGARSPAHTNDPTPHCRSLGRTAATIAAGALLGFVVGLMLGVEL